MTGRAGFRAAVRGRVQGVGFRWATREEARRLGVCGWVRNLPDGRVEALVVGSVDQLARMREFLERGPAMARVDAVDYEQGMPAEVFSDFQIR